MTPIEIIEGRYGYKILTGIVETDISALKIVGIVVRSAGATFAKLEVNDVDVVTARGLSVGNEVTDPPLLAGYSGNTTKFFTLVKMTNATDSICLLFSE